MSNTVFTPSIEHPGPWQALRQLLGNRSLRTKLILAFLAVVALSIGVVAIFANQATHAALSAEVGENLHSQAEIRAFIVADWIDQQVSQLSTLGKNEVVREQMTAISSEYTGEPAAIRAVIQQLDQQWRSAEENSSLTQKYLHNPIVDELTEVFPNNPDIIVTDQYGALAAAAAYLPTYDQSHEHWWQAAYNGGQGAIYIGQPQNVASQENATLFIALPLYHEDSNQVIGVVRIRHSMQSLTAKLAEVRFAETGDTDVLLPDGQLLRSEGNLVAIEAEELLNLQQHANSLSAELDYDHEYRLVSQAPVVARTGQSEAITALGWKLIVDQDPAEAFAPISAAVRSTLFTGLAALFLAGVLAVVVAQTISAPVKQLTQTVQQIASGDLSPRLSLGRRDEIGILASGVNTMTDALETRIATERQAQIETERLQQAETEGRQQLEQAVGDYLAFVERVAQGDLTQRLMVQHEGVLGQLGRGLNGMVDSLQHISGQVQQATNAITSAAAEILSATTQQAASANEQSAAITQTTTTVEEVKAIAAQTAERAGRVAQDSQSALAVAREGAGAVEETVNGMGHIRARVEGIAQTILALAEQTQAIGTIIATVSELADQSNLLALNAAIEAARAGEQGKSFAVVAQHVRDLAERSKGATAQVKEILSEIQRTTNAAVLATEEGTKGVEVGGKLATSAGQVIHKIAGEVESGAQASIQIAAAAQQQTAGMEQIGLAMTNIQQATLQALTSTRQAERAAQDMHTLAQSLHKAIMAYRI
jgi:methyl-accepting chemotaxis protein